MPMPTPDLSTLTPEQRQSFDADMVRLQSSNPFAGSLPTHYTVSIDDTARLGAIAMKQSGYIPGDLDLVNHYTVPEVLDMADSFDNPQDQNNALALYAMGLQAEFNQSSADRAMQFNAEQAWLNRDWQTSANQKAMDFSAEQAQLNRDWQERMSNTAYQRAMKDLKDSGLNPILAYTQGGAATTSGSTASGFSSSGSSASGVAASSSMSNFDFATNREFSLEQYRMAKEVELKKMDYVDHTINNIITGLMNMGSAILRGGNTYNFNK